MKQPSGSCSCQRSEVLACSAELVAIQSPGRAEQWGGGRQIKDGEFCSCRFWECVCLLLQGWVTVVLHREPGEYPGLCNALCVDQPWWVSPKFHFVQCLHFVTLVIPLDVIRDGSIDPGSKACLPAPAIGCHLLLFEQKRLTLGLISGIEPFTPFPEQPP